MEEEGQPSALDSEEYEQRGKRIAYIYHFNEFFTSGEKKKNARNNDVDHLKATLQQRKFEVTVKGSESRMISKELLESVRAVAQTTEETACVWLFIMTCEENYGPLSYRGLFDFSDILEPFMEGNCSSALKGVPKLFFIQNDVGALPVTVHICGRFDGPIRHRNEYPVTFDPDVLVSYFQRDSNEEPSMAWVLSHEIRKNNRRNINNILTAIIARKLWDNPPKFSSTLTLNFCIPESTPPPKPVPEPTPVLTPAPVQETLRSINSRGNSSYGNDSRSRDRRGDGWGSSRSRDRRGDDWGSAAKRPHLKKELELFMEAKRELAVRRRALEEAGYFLGPEDDEDSDEDLFYPGGDWTRGRGPRRDWDDRDSFAARWMARVMGMMPFGSRSSRDRDDWRRMEERLWAERRWREEMDSRRRPWGGMRRMEEEERILRKCAPAGDEASSSSSSTSQAISGSGSSQDKVPGGADPEAGKANEKEEEKKKSEDGLEPLDESGPIVENRNADILLALACTDGHVSFQSNKGSVFISRVCNVLENCSDGEDLLTAISVAMGRVAEEIDVSGDKQMPTFTSSLRKRVALDLPLQPSPA